MPRNELLLNGEAAPRLRLNATTNRRKQRFTIPNETRARLQLNERVNRVLDQLYGHHKSRLV